MLAFSALPTGVICFCGIRAISSAGIVVFSAFYGFTQERVVSTLSACFTIVLKDPRNIGTYIDLGMVCVLFEALIGTPISGMLARQHGFDAVSEFSGVPGGFTKLVVKKLASVEWLEKI
ncbi:uncharacterized protein ATNIH1004_004533 [Aspergillus tanneri]|nr:uncharacterized protein ATNIH1004_004533 [Aspergillus tanneri]KAA8648648.1 hypothetical protein ATNIH1004_004533 [Aspergillus tanneri]